MKLSIDDGKTWRFARMVDPGPSGYSDMAVSPSGAVYLLYEAERKNSDGPFVPRTITLARFNPSSFSP